MKRSAFAILVGLVLVYGYATTFLVIVPSVYAQTEVKRVYNIRAATVDLPPGQRFMYIIPKEQADGFGVAKVDRNIYVTHDIADTRGARLIRFLQPGNTPGSWDEVLYIQER